MTQADLIAPATRPGAATPLGLRLIGLLLMGGVGLGIAIVLPELTFKSMAFGGMAVCVGLLLVISGRPKEILIAAYVFALTYNRQFYSFTGLLGDQGPQGLYWVPADLVLVVLATVQVMERVMGRASEPPVPRVPTALVLWPAFVFLVPCILSALFADKPELAFNELVRVAKFVIVLAWLQRTMTMSMWYAAVAALAASVALQGFLGVLQVAMRADRGFLTAFGVAADRVVLIDGLPDLMENRGRGTMGHPNFLGPYLLTLVPCALGALLYSRGRLLRYAALVVLLAGLAGLVSTKSRAPIALIVGGLGLVVVVAVCERRLSLPSAAAGAVLGVTMLAAAAVPFIDAIYERLQGDFSASVTFRADYNATAVRMWNDAPLVGVGLNNFSHMLADYSQHFYHMNKSLQEASRDADVRAMAPVHNVYLLVLSETGVLGLGGFIILLAAAFWRAVRGALVSDGAVRGICVGLAAGMVLQWAQQMLDFSLWLDPYWYTMALTIALVGMIPTHRPVLR